MLSFGCEQHEGQSWHRKVGGRGVWGAAGVGLVKWCPACPQTGHIIYMKQAYRGECHEVKLHML